jgi:hypothetical protein
MVFFRQHTFGSGVFGSDTWRVKSRWEASLGPRACCQHGNGGKSHEVITALTQIYLRS